MANSRDSKDDNDGWGNDENSSQDDEKVNIRANVQANLGNVKKKIMGGEEPTSSESSIPEDLKQRTAEQKSAASNRVNEARASLKEKLNFRAATPAATSTQTPPASEVTRAPVSSSPSGQPTASPASSSASAVSPVAGPSSSPSQTRALDELRIAEEKLNAEVARVKRLQGQYEMSIDSPMMSDKKKAEAKKSLFDALNKAIGLELELKNGIEASNANLQGVPDLASYQSKLATAHNDLEAIVTAQAPRGYARPIPPVTPPPAPATSAQPESTEQANVNPPPVAAQQQAASTAVPPSQPATGESAGTPSTSQPPPPEPPVSETRGSEAKTQPSAEELIAQYRAHIRNESAASAIAAYNQMRAEETAQAPDPAQSLDEDLELEDFKLDPVTVRSDAEPADNDEDVEPEEEASPELSEAEIRAEREEIEAITRRDPHYQDPILDIEGGDEEEAKVAVVPASDQPQPPPTPPTTASAPAISAATNVNAALARVQAAQAQANILRSELKSFEDQLTGAQGRLNRNEIDELDREILPGQIALMQREIDNRRPRLAAAIQEAQDAVSQLNAAAEAAPATTPSPPAGGPAPAISAAANVNAASAAAQANATAERVRVAEERVSVAEAKLRELQSQIAVDRQDLGVILTRQNVIRDDDLLGLSATVSNAERENLDRQEVAARTKLEETSSRLEAAQQELNRAVDRRFAVLPSEDLPRNTSAGVSASAPQPAASAASPAVQQANVEAIAQAEARVRAAEAKVARISDPRNPPPQARAQRAQHQRDLDEAKRGLNQAQIQLNEARAAQPAAQPPSGVQVGPKVELVANVQAAEEKLKAARDMLRTKNDELKSASPTDRVAKTRELVAQAERTKNAAAELKTNYEQLQRDLPETYRAQGEAFDRRHKEVRDTVLPDITTYEQQLLQSRSVAAALGSPAASAAVTPATPAQPATTPAVDPVNTAAEKVRIAEEKLRGLEALVTSLENDEKNAATGRNLSLAIFRRDQAQEELRTANSQLLAAQTASSSATPPPETPSTPGQPATPGASPGAPEAQPQPVQTQPDPVKEQKVQEAERVRIEAREALQAKFNEFNGAPGTPAQTRELVELAERAKAASSNLTSKLEDFLSTANTWPESEQSKRASYEEKLSTESTTLQGLTDYAADLSRRYPEAKAEAKSESKTETKVEAKVTPTERAERVVRLEAAKAKLSAAKAEKVRVKASLDAKLQEYDQKLAREGKLVNRDRDEARIAIASGDLAPANIKILQAGVEVDKARVLALKESTAAPTDAELDRAQALREAKDNVELAQAEVRDEKRNFEEVKRISDDNVRGLNTRIARMGDAKDSKVGVSEKKEIQAHLKKVEDAQARLDAANAKVDRAKEVASEAKRALISEIKGEAKAATPDAVARAKSEPEVELDIARESAKELARELLQKQVSELAAMTGRVSEDATKSVHSTDRVRLKLESKDSDDPKVKHDWLDFKQLMDRGSLGKYKEQTDATNILPEGERMNIGFGMNFESLARDNPNWKDAWDKARGEIKDAHNEFFKEFGTEMDKLLVGSRDSGGYQAIPTDKDIDRVFNEYLKDTRIDQIFQPILDSTPPEKQEAVKAYVKQQKEQLREQREHVKENIEKDFMKAVAEVRLAPHDLYDLQTGKEAQCKKGGEIVSLNGGTMAEVSLNARRKLGELNGEAWYTMDDKGVISKEGRIKPNIKDGEHFIYAKEDKKNKWENAFILAKHGDKTSLGRICTGEPPTEKDLKQIEKQAIAFKKFQFDQGNQGKPVYLDLKPGADGKLPHIEEVKAMIDAGKKQGLTIRLPACLDPSRKDEPGVKSKVDQFNKIDPTYLTTLHNYALSREKGLDPAASAAFRADDSKGAEATRRFGMGGAH